VASSYPSVRVETGPVFETVAELAAFSSGPARPSLESGKGWVRRVRQLAGPNLIRRVEQWAFPLYTELASIALEAGPPFDARTLSARLRATKPQVLQRRLLGAESPPNRAMVSDGAFDRALRGESSAQAELRGALGLNPEARAGLDRLFAAPPGRLRQEISAIVDGWAERVSPAFAQASMVLVERDAESKAAMLRTADPRDALREFTNGVDVDPAGWASQIVVIPAVALRPFIAPVEWQSTLMLVVSVADEVMDTVAGGPPRRLVKAAAALGDELRLRILHELGNGERTATELADLLGVERTSLHHHLGILRSAGLVTVTAESDQVWRYSLRKDGLDDVSATLSSYLGP
jgi:DNA-binding transcriptional ArsR family regulator